MKDSQVGLILTNMYVLGVLTRGDETWKAFVLAMAAAIWFVTSVLDSISEARGQDDR